jgi:peptide/nickel transport system permease protein
MTFPTDWEAEKMSVMEEQPGHEKALDALHELAHDAGDIRGTERMWRQMFRVFVGNKLAVASISYVILVVLFCFVGPFFYHSNQLDASASLGFVNAAPQKGFPLGADYQGFDILGRLMFAGQSSLELGFLAAMISLVVGVGYGIFSGYVGGWIDSLLMRIVDVMLSIPGLFLLLATISLFGRSKTLLILVLGLTGWFGDARLLRGEAIALRDREFAQAVRAMGGGSGRIIWRHILPNTVSTMMTVSTFALAGSILALTSLGFLGLGIPLPQTDWGAMIQFGSQNFQIGCWWQVYPVCGLFLLLIISFNYIGDAMRDMFEVRLRER